VLLVYAATALAIAAWEPRFRLTGVEIEKADVTGALSLRIGGVYEGDRVTGRVPVERA
jgi:phage baseplate assembly protein W